MKAFVTGGTGFIGKRVVHKLLERGYIVNALARSPQGIADLEAMGAHPIQGDIADPESMRAGMQGCDVVFHLAAWYKLGAPDWRKAEAINVDGTRNVLSLAFELGISKIIYTSTVAVFSDTHGYMADENYQYSGTDFLTEYDRTKWLAHYKVAVPLIDRGAPIIIVMPGAVYGPGDTSLVGDIMRAYYRGFLPVLPGPELTLTYAHVDDIAEGHILAAEKGRPGESYLLVGPAMSLGELIKIWSKVTGRSAPLFSVPARFIKPLAPIVKTVSSVVRLPAMISYDAVVILDATYIARADKARHELGWEPRSVEEGMRQTFDALSQSRHQPATPRNLSAAQRRLLAGIAIGSALGLLLAWLWKRRRR